MKPFTTLNGIVAPLDAIHVNTDQIIPKQFLKGVERTGYGRFLFYDWRYLNEGQTPDPAFEMNAPRYRGASILLAKDNFGCGSSREQAPWALSEYGFRCVVAPSFADIFYGNCFYNGILPVVLDAEIVESLFREVRAVEGYRLTVDLNALTVTTPDGREIFFEADPFKKAALLTAPDEIERILAHEDAIAEYEQAHRRSHCTGNLVPQIL